MSVFHLRRLAGNIAAKLGNAYLRYQIASWRRVFHYNGNTAKAGDIVYRFADEMESALTRGLRTSNHGRQEINNM